MPQSSDGGPDATGRCRVSHSRGREENGQPFDCSTATVKTLKFQKPDGVIIARDATFATDGKDGVVTYKTADGDLDQAGPWVGQASVELPDGRWSTESFNFVVGDTLDG